MKFNLRIFIAMLLLSTTVAFAAPIRITKGGTYQGAFSSDDPDVAAVTIATSDTVYLINSTISSRGPCIEVTEKGGHIIIRNVHGIGLHPKRDRAIKGRFFDSGNMRDIKYLLIENCFMEGTSGIRVRDCRDATVLIRYNEARHIDGRLAKARDGEYYGNEAFGFRSTADNRQFIAMRNCENMRASIVAWNKVINVANEGSNWGNYAKGGATPLPAQEDVFNFNASGRLRDSIYVSNNLAVGAYAFEPRTTLAYTGGGFIADGGDCAYLVFDGNYAINIQNYSFSVATGGAVIFRYNTGVSSGYLPDGTVSGYNSLAHSHQLNRSPGSEFYGNRAAYVRTRPRGEIGARNDTRFVNCGAGKCRDTEALLPGRLPTLQDEVTYILEWQLRAATLGLTIGLSDSGPVPQPPDPPQPVPYPKPTPDPDPNPTPPEAVSGAFRIVTPGSPGQPGPALADGDTVYLEQYPAFSIEAVKGSGTVTFTLNGEFVRTDGAPPYLMCGNRGWQSYAQVDGCAWTPGKKVLTADGATVTFYVAEKPAPAPSPVPEPQPARYQIQVYVNGEPRLVDLPANIIPLFFPQ